MDIYKIYKASKGCYGAPKTHKILKKNGKHVSLKRVHDIWQV